MTFQFTPYISEAGPAFEMPAMPIGVDFILRMMVDEYIALFVADQEDAEAIESTLAEIVAHPAKSPSDLAAKAIVALHEANPGLYDGKPIILDHFETANARKFAEAHLSDLFGMIPSDWATARAAYETAFRAEEAFFKGTWKPAFDIQAQGGLRIPDDAEAKMERLIEARLSAEFVLMDIPSPTADDMAFKMLVAFDADCDRDRFLPGLVDEARRFAASAVHRQSEGAQ